LPTRAAERRARCAARSGVRSSSSATANAVCFGGAALFFDFQNRPGRGNSSLISSTFTLGYSWDCCAITLQDAYFNVGLRKENRVVFSFRLNGIGTFGTEQIGQNFR
jgi:hypothetical protein